MTKTDTNLLSAYRKKQELIKYYHRRLGELRSEQKSISHQMAKAKLRFDQLINSEEDIEQLKLFDNLDEYLREVEPDAEEIY